MNKKYLWWILPIPLIAMFFFGIFSGAVVENYLMDDYKLYNCVYSNADNNDFPKNPHLVQKIQEECICFFNHNFTNVFDNC